MKTKLSNYLIIRPEWLLIMSLSLTACGGGGSSKNTNTNSSAIVSSASLVAVSSSSSNSLIANSSSIDASSSIGNSSSIANSSIASSSSVITSSSVVTSSSSSSVVVVIDGIAPTVSLASNTTSVTTAGTVNLTATATDNIGVTKVEFYEGTTLLNTDTASPFSYAVNISGTQNTTRYYSAKAFDSSNNVTTSNLISVVVNIDDEAPTFSYFSLTATNIIFVSPFSATATVTDNLGVTKVEFYRGTTLVGTDTTSPYKYIFTPTWEDNGTYAYTAKAYDAKGNVKTSNAVNVTINIPVQNPIDETLSINGPTRVITNTLTGYYTTSNYAPTLTWEWYDDDAAVEGFSVSKGWRVPTGSAYVSVEYGEHLGPLESEGSLNNIVVIGTPLVAGYAHSCALKPDNSIMCWGNNFYGALGDNSTTNAASPVSVSGVTAIALGAGDEHTCALKNNFTVVCWGRNDAGQLGNNSNNNSSTPVDVTGLANIRSLAVGAQHTCVVDSNLKVKCWGDNVYGQLGNSSVSTSSDSLVPVEVDNFTDAMTVAAGKYNTCAIKKGGTVWCWGNGYFGQLGDGKPNVVQSVAPVQVSGLTNAISISVGDRFACATTADGKAWCWGRNQYGQLGNNSTTDSYVPVQVQGVTGNSIAVGAEHACLASPSGGYCWGNSGWGNLGNGTMSASSIPVAVTSVNTPAYIAAGNDHTCALLNDGTVKCWGYDASGQLGNGAANASPYSTTPVAVSGGAIFWK